MNATCGWTPNAEELAAINQLAIAKDLSPAKVITQALRTYQKLYLDAIHGPAEPMLEPASKEISAFQVRPGDLLSVPERGTFRVFKVNLLVNGRPPDWNEGATHVEIRCEVGDHIEPVGVWRLRDNVLVQMPV